jgi:hypothetical protein
VFCYHPYLLKKSGNCIIPISVTSKSNATNNSNKTIAILNNILDRFLGYKLDQVALALSKQKNFGRDY